MKETSVPYDFELELVSNEIMKRKAKRVLLQFPEGFLQYSRFVAEELRRGTNSTIYISGRVSYGGCDIAVDEALAVKADLIVHFGHTSYDLQKNWRGETPPILYVPVKSLIEPSKREIENMVELLVRNGLVQPILIASVQHVHILPLIKNQFEARGLRPLLTTSRAGLPGQVLGCDYRILRENEERFDSVVIVAGGEFHIRGAVLVTDKPVLHFDPYSRRTTLHRSEHKRLIMQRFAVMTEALKHDLWAIWISTKSGQYRPWLRDVLEAELRRKGIKYELIISDSTGPYEIRNLSSTGIHVHVLTSCPRIPIDDTEQLKGEILLTPGEALMVLRDDYEKYRFPW